ncbi:basic membrane protein A [Bradyrhizobium diazoefficiens]
MDIGRISRRHLLQGGAALTLGAAAGARPAFAADTTIGFIYVGSRDDYGYNQAHAQGAAALKKIPGLKVVEEEKVPETDAVEKTIESMINLDGATLLFPTSFGYYNPHMIKMANKFPKLRFEHCGGLWTDKDPKNAGSYFGYIDEAQYISGIVAGYTSKSGKLGFVAAKPIPQVLRNINAFALGAKLANPKATTQVIFTGDWSMPVKEAEATNSLIDQGVDVLTCHVDGPKTMVENAARRGAFVCGYHTNQSPLAPKAYLTGRRVELGSALSEIRQDDRRRREHPELLSRRPQGRDRQDLALWRSRLRRSAQACRRHQGQVLVGGRIRDLQGRARRQQGQDGDPCRHRSGPEGS